MPFTSTDYPDALAAVVFCQGCPWRCGYCHNPHLIPARGDDERDFARILEWLASRRGLLDAVVFSGGEPTAQAGLSAAIDAVRALGFAIGLHTAARIRGASRRSCRRSTGSASTSRRRSADYARSPAFPGSGFTAFASLDLVRSAGVAITRCARPSIPTSTPPAALERLARELAARGIERWVLQPFRATGCANEALVAAAPNGAMPDRALLMRLSDYVPVIEVRGS